MISNYMKVCLILLIPHCHATLLDYLGLGSSRPQQVVEKGECAHWGSVNPYAAPFTTATGELFNSNDYIAAHRTLPIGSYATVTNMNPGDGRSVVVRITGKGPFSEGRLMELSPAAFNQISDISEAVIPCSVSIKPAGGGYPQQSGGSYPRPHAPHQSGGYPNRPGYERPNPESPYEYDAKSSFSVGY